MRPARASQPNRMACGGAGAGSAGAGSAGAGGHASTTRWRWAHRPCFAVTFASAPPGGGQARSGAERRCAMRRKVEDVMTAEVVTVEQGTPFKAIVRLLEEQRISAVPVVDEHGTVVGVVSEADLLAKERYPHGRNGLSAVEGLRNRTALHKAEGVIAAELMSSPPVTARLGSTIGEAARLAASAGVKRLPVADEQRRLVGIVTRSDLLKVFMRPDEEIRREVAEII